MNQRILTIFAELKIRIKQSKGVSTKQQNLLLREIMNLENEFAQLEIRDEKIYLAMVKKGEEVLRGICGNLKTEVLDEVKTFLRYARAATYDFRGDLKDLNYLLRLYIITAILFMALSPQFFGFLLPAVFILPIYLGLKGMKQRGKLGFTLAMSLIPVAILTATVWIRYAVYALSNFNQVSLEMARDLHHSLGMAKALIVIPSILAFVLLGTALCTAYLGYKSRQVFV